MSEIEIILRLSLSLIFGLIIGIERQWHHKNAGLKTNTLVAVGSTAFAMISEHGFGPNSNPAQVAAGVVTGIGFLGAGVIMRRGGSIQGINTAATLWASAAVGSCAGADMIAQSAALTLFVLAGNTLLRPLVNAIDRIPLNEQTSEANYELIVTTDAGRAATVREALGDRLELAKYPVRETRVVYRSTDNVEVSAMLVSLAVDPADLDAVAAELAKLPGVSHATWNVSALD